MRTTSQIGVAQLGVAQEAAADAPLGTISLDASNTGPLVVNVFAMNAGAVIQQGSHSGSKGGGRGAFWPWMPSKLEFDLLVGDQAEGE